jgi:hypothetical protein
MMSSDVTYSDDRPDLGPRAMRPSKILQQMSAELQPGPNRLDGAAPGDILVCYADGSQKLFPRVVGVPLLPVVFVEKAMEWPAQRGTGTPPIVHDFVPPAAEWLVVDASGRKACLMPNGNKIEKTVLCHALVEGLPTTFSFRSTAYQFGVNFGREADRIRVEVENEIVRVCGAFYRLTSELERNQRGEPWYGPRCTRLGVMGEANGPSLDLVRKAKAMRFEFKVEEERSKRERLAAVTPTPPLIGNQPPRGTTTYTTGLKWSDPKPEAPKLDSPALKSDKPEPPVLPKSADPNDSIPW